MIRALGVAILPLAPMQNLWAQSIPNQLEDLPAHMHHAQTAAGLPAGVIDGAENPEQIPDSTAYRLFLITVAEETSPTSDRQSRQHAFLRSAGLDDSDINKAIPVLAEFKAEYGNLIEQYNKSVATDDAGGIAPDVLSFLSRREQLVQDTRDSLAAALSSDGLIRLHTHVQDEKRRMKVAVKEGQ